MNVHQLPKITERRQKRIGRGHGSGKVKTAGRGQKGQKARGKIRHGFEGGQASIFHRLPFMRGKNRNHSQKGVVVAVSLSKLTEFSSGDTITIASLIEKKVINSSVRNAKLIGVGPVDKKFTVTGISVSKGARLALEKAGGTITE
jgi:large subunit ribosomal protein L15